MKPTTFTPLPAGAVRLQGPLGHCLDRVIANRLMKVDYGRLVDVFRQRSENDGAWRCEFWGKIVRSAVFAWRATGDKALRQLLEATVNDMLSTQTPDGRISSYPEEKQLQRWDIWGRKYVMLALLAYYQEIDPRPDIREALIRMADDLIDQTGGDFWQYGEHCGLAAASILRALVELYEIGGQARHLETARSLVSRAYSVDFVMSNIFHQNDAGIPPPLLANGKAYEMTSCFQGLLALANLTDNPNMLATVRNYYNRVNDQEITVTGTGGGRDLNGEFWYMGAIHQTSHIFGGCGETCVTATWLAFSRMMLETTAVSLIADGMERSLYNALLGAATLDGSNFIHINPYLDGTGWKELPADQINTCFHSPFDGHDCCRAQGPYGLTQAPLAAVMKTINGYVVNLYEDLTVDGIFTITGGYPANGDLILTLLTAGDFELAFRLPAEFGCQINGIETRAGGYARIRRNWRPGDIVSIRFDVAPRPVSSPADGRFVATACGPLVMAKPARRPASFLRRDGELFDYASVGQTNCPDDTFQVWFPQQQQ